MRIHSTCGTCNCHEPIKNWLYATLIPAPGHLTPLRDIWMRYLDDFPRSDMNAYRQAGLTAIITRTARPDGRGDYTTHQGRLLDWTLSSPTGAST